MPIFVSPAYGKSAKTGLTAAEKRTVSAIAAALKSAWKGQK